jgi:hypothetical protein
MSAGGLKIGLGAQVSMYGLTQEMKSEYGNHPASASVFLRIRPKGNMAEHMQLMHEQRH